jgi:ABC-type transporter Mla subunit MlaD
MHKKAFIGIIIILILFAANVIYIGNKNLWFEAKNSYWTILHTGEGLREGTLVTLSGLNCGEVTELQPSEDNKIRVVFTIRASLTKRLTDGSFVKVLRAMMIGEKKLEVVPGPRGKKQVPENSYIPGLDLQEMTDLLSTDQLKQFTPQLERILDNVDIITSSLAKNRDMFDKIVITLDEAHLMMRAMERSFLFKASVQEVMREDLKKKEKK